MQSLGGRESRRSKAFKIVVVGGALFLITRSAIHALGDAFSYAGAWKILLDPVILSMAVLCFYLFRLIAKPLREIDECHRKMDQAMDNERENLKAIFGASPVGMLLLDAPMTIQKANQAMGRISGSNAPDLLNQRLSVAMGCEKTPSGTGRDCMQCAFHETCKVFTAVFSVLNTHEPVHGLEVELNRPANKARSRLWLL
ncbi:MAG: PAS domain-containing protein, partial [Planctomycetes bacterium]|nr:PAS domain-containing protein [Planctomycetota bacterium]